jgi:hypothetical protein
MGPAVEMLEDMKFPEDLILNLTARRVLDYLKAKHPHID